MIPLITAQAVAFWVFAPLAVAGGLGMVLSRKPVHSAISLAGMMVALGCLYASLDAPFLFVAQIIVYTGAVMMLFIFTMMIVGVDTVDSLVETIRGQRVASTIFAAALALLLIIAIGQGVVASADGLAAANAQHGGNVQGVAQIVFGPFVFAFELTAALLLVAALAAIILAHGERWRRDPARTVPQTRETQNWRDCLPNPGVAGTTTTTRRCCRTARSPRTRSHPPSGSAVSRSSRTTDCAPPTAPPSPSSSRPPTNWRAPAWPPRSPSSSTTRAWPS